MDFWEGFMAVGRPPHGGRGLKCRILTARSLTLASSPSRGTWIEMSGVSSAKGANDVVPLTGDVD